MSCPYQSGGEDPPAAPSTAEQPEPAAAARKQPNGCPVDHSKVDTTNYMKAGGEKNLPVSPSVVLVVGRGECCSASEAPTTAASVGPAFSRCRHQGRPCPSTRAGTPQPFPGHLISPPTIKLTRRTNGTSPRPAAALSMGCTFHLPNWLPADWPCCATQGLSFPTDVLQRHAAQRLLAE